MITMKPITPELKNRVLEYLVNDPTDLESHFQIDDDHLYKAFDIDFKTLEFILRMFESEGLIEDLNARPHAVFLTLFTKAYQFFQEGGYSS
jgi:hypothetical protein